MSSPTPFGLAGEESIKLRAEVDDLKLQVMNLMSMVAAKTMSDVRIKVSASSHPELVKLGEVLKKLDEE